MKIKVLNKSRKCKTFMKSDLFEKLDEDFKYD